MILENPIIRNRLSGKIEMKVETLEQSDLNRSDSIQSSMSKDKSFGHLIGAQEQDEDPEEEMPVLIMKGPSPVIEKSNESTRPKIQKSVSMDRESS